MGRKRTLKDETGIAPSATAAESSRLARTREMLIDREARLKAILDTAVDGIITIDEHGIIESVNQATEGIFGYRSEELLGKNVKLLMPSPYHEEHDAYLARYLRTGEARIIGIGREVEGKHKDGTRFPIELAVSEIRVAGSRVFTGVVRDISARRQAEDEARRRNAELAHAARLSTIGELTSGIAHEVNQPLFAIVSNAQPAKRLLERQQPDLDEAREALTDIVNDGSRASDIIKNVRSLVRKEQRATEQLDLNQVTREAIQFIEPEIQKRRLTLRAELQEELPPIMGNSIEIQQVILNLVVNARDAMPGGGKLTICTEDITVETRQHDGPFADVEPGDYVRLALGDTGTGMSQEVLAQVFEPFFTTKEPGRGMGLGLFLTRAVIEKLGGSLSLDSRVGSGTRVEVTLPV